MLHEVRQCAEFAREDEIKQRPQFLEVVLNGTAAENDAMGCAELWETKQTHNHCKHYVNRINYA